VGSVGCGVIGLPLRLLQKSLAATVTSVTPPSKHAVILSASASSPKYTVPQGRFDGSLSFVVDVTLAAPYSLRHRLGSNGDTLRYSVAATVAGVDEDAAALAEWWSGGQLRTSVVDVTDPTLCSDAHPAASCKRSYAVSVAFVDPFVYEVSADTSSLPPSMS
jgi:hypothetical protein